MKKHLVHDEDDYVRLFKDYDFASAEKLLGIQFAFENGYYPEDPGVDESQDVSKTVFRKLEDSHFPETYPCVVLLANETDNFRTTFKFQMIEFVYLSDFES